MSQTIWIARHGNREDFVDVTWLKTAERPFDPGLSPDGFAQAQKLANYLQGNPIDHLFCSPFLRTVQTAHIIAETLDLSIKVEAGLSEFVFFPLIPFLPELLPRPILAKKFPRIDESYHSQIIVKHPESLTEFEQRSHQIIERLTHQFSGNILLVTHQAPLISMTRNLLKKNIKLNAGLCCLMKLVNSEIDWQLELNGETSFLQENPVNPWVKEFKSIKRYVLHKLILMQRLKQIEKTNYKK